jgi:hypothetical protein
VRGLLVGLSSFSVQRGDGVTQPLYLAKDFFVLLRRSLSVFNRSVGQRQWLPVELLHTCKLKKLVALVLK